MEFIYETKNVWDKFTCKNIIERFEKDSRKSPGRMIDGIDTDVKVSTDLIFSDDHMVNDWKDIFSLTFSTIKENLDKHVNNIINIDPDKYSCVTSPVLKYSITVPQIQKTSKNGFYTWHTDAHMNRVFTYIIYLNDVNFKDGGSTEFLHGRSIQPETGKLVLFPSGLPYIHRGKELKNGSKYIITGFICERE